MRRLPSFLLFLLVCHYPGCVSSDSSGKKDAPPPAETAGSPASPAGQPAAVKANSTIVTATVDSVVVLDDVHYKMAIHTTSAEAAGELSSLAEKGQSMVVTPEYVLTEEGKEDPASDRNRKLLSLRAAKPGQIIRGLVSLRQDGKWVLTEVFEHE